MGLFSKERVVNVATSGVKLTEDDSNPVKDAVASSVGSSSDITVGLLDSNINGFAGRCDALYIHAKNSFYRGLPEGYVSSVYTKREDALAVLLLIEGVEVVLDDILYDLPDPYFVALELYQRGLTNTVQPLETGNELIGSTLRMTHSNVEEGTNVYNFPTINGVVEGTPCYMVAYRLPDEGLSITRWFVYNPTTGVYPELPVIDFNSANSSFYPMIPIRKGGGDTDPREFINLEVDGEPVYPKAHKQTEKALKYLGVKLDDILESMGSDPETEEVNPNLENTDDTFIMLALDIQEDSQHGLAYLDKFFRNAGVEAQYGRDDFVAYTNIEDNVEEPPRNVIRISEEVGKTLDGEEFFNSAMAVTLAFLYVETGEVTKTIGKVGLRSSETTLVDEEGEELSLDKTGYGRRSLKGIDITYITFFKQKRDGVCEYVRVVGMEHYATVYEGKQALKTLKTSVDVDVETGERTDLAFFIPISRDVLHTFYGQERSKICYTALYMYIYSSDVQYLKWYQQKWFANLLKFIAIVIFLWSLGSATSVAEVLWVIAEGLATMLLVRVIVNILLRFINPELLLVFLVVAAVYAGYNLESLSEMLSSAITLLQVVQITATVFAEVTVQTTESIMDEMSKNQAEYTAWLEEKEDELEELEGDYESTTFDEAALNRPDRIVHESPTSFFNRTIHIGNIGVMSLDMIESFVDNMLKLPKERLE